MLKHSCTGKTNNTHETLDSGGIMVRVIIILRRLVYSHQALTTLIKSNNIGDRPTAAEPVQETRFILEEKIKTKQDAETETETTVF